MSLFRIWVSQLRLLHSRNVIIHNLAKNKSFDEYLNEMNAKDEDRKERKFKKYFTLKGKILKVAKTNCKIY
jgi:hypothetical protein